MPLPASPVRILLHVLEEIVGPESDVARYMTKAVQSEDPLDLMLAQAAFDELDVSYRSEISSAVTVYVRQMLAA